MAKDREIEDVYMGVLANYGIDIISAEYMGGMWYVEVDVEYLKVKEIEVMKIEVEKPSILDCLEYLSKEVVRRNSEENK